MSTTINDKGFTLIELLVVVSIVGILAAIGISSFQEYKTRAYKAASETYIHNGITDVQAYLNTENPLDDLLGDKRWYENRTAPTLEFEAETLLPTAKIGKGYRLRARVQNYLCPDPTRDRFALSSLNVKVDFRVFFRLECDGTETRTVYPKSIGGWWS